MFETSEHTVEQLSQLSINRPFKYDRLQQRNINLKMSSTQNKMLRTELTPLSLSDSLVDCCRENVQVYVTASTDEIRRHFHRSKLS